MLGVIEQVFARRAERGASGKIQSLRYFGPAVEAAWQEVAALTAAGRRREPEGLDVDARLRALAAALPPELPDRQRLAERILALGGDTSEVEAGLAVLDEEMIAAAMASLSDADRQPLERRTRKALAALAGRVGEEELAEARRRLLRQALRRARGLPVLSLFSPEAAGGD